MEYDAITIDTSVFKSEKFNFTGKNLENIKNLTIKNVRFILSEIVQKELVHILELETDIIKSKLKETLNKESLYNIFPLNTQEERKKINEIDIKKHVNAKIQDYLTAMNCEIISCKNIDSAVLSDMYFNKISPFSTKKKNEFPDAIALMSLEKWAIQNKKNVLVVSSDGDWFEFCKGKQNLKCVKTLGNAFNLIFNSLKTQYDQIIKCVLKNKVETTNNYVRNFLNSPSVEIMTNTSFYGYAYTQSQQIILDNLEYCADKYKILNITDKEIKISIPLDMKIFVNASYIYTERDTEIHEDIIIAEQEIDEEVELNKNIIITISHNKCNIDNSEIVDICFDKPSILLQFEGIEIYQNESDYEDLYEDYQSQYRDAAYGES